ncbi:hypothetical protein Leryth_022250 [Lithospermum erythrorhizon]|nr:hypothetical protein Leryth_022250 [Lithospermum erythrorhizon]
MRKTSNIEIQIYLNDLPGNDFNLIFRSLPNFQEKLRKNLASDVGQFFSWDREGNKGNICLANSSPEGVVRAYIEQFEKDFFKFLECRSVEVVDGGYMVLTFLGRRSANPCSKQGSLIWQLLAKALQDMVSEGMIEEDKLHSFNIPQYTPCPAELKQLIEQEGSFKIDRLEVTSVNWNAYEGDNITCLSDGAKDGGYNVTKCMRAVAEPMLLDHFGEEIIEEVFYKYRQNISDCMSKENQQFINVTVSVTKKD